MRAEVVLGGANIVAISHVRNPLSVIAIFASLAELGGTAVMPLLVESVQETYVWFLMLFPTLIVCLFFVTLWFAHTKLYAPSDFKDENLFVAAAGTRLYAKIEEEIAQSTEAVEEGPPETNDNAPSTSTAPPPPQDVEEVSPPGHEVSSTLVHRATADALEMYLEAEDLAVAKLEGEFGGRFTRRVSPKGMQTIVFDAVQEKENGGLDVLEVKLVRNRAVYSGLSAKRLFESVTSYYWTLPEASRQSFRLIYAVVFENVPESQRHKYLHRLLSDLRMLPFVTQLRGFTLEDLKKRHIKQGTLV